MFRSANLMFSLIWHYTVPPHIFSLSSLRCMSIIVLSLTISVLGSSCNYLLILDLFSRLFNVCLFLGIPSCIKKKAKEPERGRKRDNYCCTSVHCTELIKSGTFILAFFLVSSAAVLVPICKTIFLKGDSELNRFKIV